MKTKDKINKAKKINNFFTILTLLMLVPLSYASNHSNFQDQVNFRNEVQHNFNLNEVKKNDFDLESAEIMLLMNKRGSLLNSHVIHNLKEENVFIITIEEQNNINTYMIEPDSSISLINSENKI